MCEAIRLGMTIKHACQYAGIDVSTYYLWMQIAREGHPRYITRREHTEFYEAVKAAEVAGMAVLLARLRKAAEDPARWMAAAWLLERRFPEEYARPAPRQEIAISGTLDARVSLEEVARDAADKLSRLLAQRTVERGADVDPEDSDPDGVASPGE